MLFSVFSLIQKYFSDFGIEFIKVPIQHLFLLLWFSKILLSLNLIFTLGRWRLWILFLICLILPPISMPSVILQFVSLDTFHLSGLYISLLFFGYLIWFGKLIRLYSGWYTFAFGVYTFVSLNIWARVFHFSRLFFGKFLWGSWRLFALNYLFERIIGLP